jgi:isopenicillin N synthase-like dioxygenase
LTHVNQLYADYENRKEEITKRLIEAAENAGFLTLVNHGITIEEIESSLKTSLISLSKSRTEPLTMLRLTMDMSIK